MRHCRIYKDEQNKVCYILVKGVRKTNLLISDSHKCFEKIIQGDVRSDSQVCSLDDMHKT